MIINEIFYSIQGEGLLAGLPSVFVRLAGCPLRCEWCDTKYALNPAAGEEMTIPKILSEIFLSRAEGRAPSHEHRHIVITGGEPMVNPQLPQLAAELKKTGNHITIETAGIKFISNIPCDLMSISPKSSYEKNVTISPSYIEAVRQLIEQYPYQLKFVVDSTEDLPDILNFVSGLGDVDPMKIMLMPQAKTREELLAKSPMVAEMCRQTGYTFCNRLQILLYDGQRGK